MSTWSRGECVCKFLCTVPVSNYKTKEIKKNMFYRRGVWPNTRMRILFLAPTHRWVDRCVRKGSRSVLQAQGGGGFRLDVRGPSLSPASRTAIKLLSSTVRLLICWSVIRILKIIAMLKIKKITSLGEYLNLITSWKKVETDRITATVITSQWVNNSARIYLKTFPCYGPEH